MFDVRLDERTVEETLSSVEAAHAVRVDAEVEIFVSAAHFADLHNQDSRDGDGQVLPGMEQARRLGGPGTPRVMEFAAAELGARIRMHPIGARNLMADALDLRHRLPAHYRQLRAGRLPVWQARKIAQATRDLSLVAARHVDAQVAPWAETLPWGRLETLVLAKIIEADPDAAQERRRAAAAERFVSTGRSNEHGLKVLIARANAGDIIWFMAMVNRIADALSVFGHPETIEVRRSEAIGILANPPRALQLLERYEQHHAQQSNERQAPSEDRARPGQAAEDDPTVVAEADLHPAQNDADDPTPATPPCPTCHRVGNDDGTTTGAPAPFTRAVRKLDPRRLLPPATLYVHIGYDAFTRNAEGVARFEQSGPITLTQAREFLAHTHVSIKPVIDLENQAPVDAYEIPDRLREAVHLRTPADIFPFATNTSRTMDGDHTETYLPPGKGGPPGQTSLANLGPMVRFHHRIKTHGKWRLKQPFPGIYLWRSPHGIHYLVDHTGTRRISERGPTHRHNPNLEIEFYPGHEPIEHTRHPAA